MYFSICLVTSRSIRAEEQNREREKRRKKKCEKE
jgi:hypothetical protein